MIAATAFVLLFVALGLGTVLVAMRRGHETPHRESARASGGAKATMLAVGILTIAIGIVVPALILFNNSGSQEKRGPGGVELTTAQVEGRHLFARNCATCHTLKGAAAVGKVGPNLDEMRPVEALTLSAIRTGRARGQGQMPSLLLTGQDAEDVASFVSAVAGR